jgi:hypothetical protein
MLSLKKPNHYLVLEVSLWYLTFILRTPIPYFTYDQVCAVCTVLRERLDSPSLLYVVVSSTGQFAKYPFSGRPPAGTENIVWDFLRLTLFMRRSCKL